MCGERYSSNIGSPNISVSDHEQISDDERDDFRTSHRGENGKNSRYPCVTKLRIMASTFAILSTFLVTMYLFTLITAASLFGSDKFNNKQNTHSDSFAVPDYFQTSPQVYAGTFGPLQHHLAL